MEQKLTPEEEQTIEDWIIRLHDWGWPPKVHQTRHLANELLRLKGCKDGVGPNWAQRFLSRHPNIKSAWIPPLEKERANAEDPVIIQGWFDKYSEIKEEKNILEEDIYNMDEKGFMIGEIGKQKALVPTKAPISSMTKPGNREWVSLIECVGMNGRKLTPWYLFKGKLQKKSWREVLREGDIVCTENGYTDNEIGMEWVKRVFDKQTEWTRKGDWRMLIVDGHASHITNEVIEYALQHKIAIMCLPPHTTHKLQPLDVSVFRPLADAYKSAVQRTSCLGAGYDINKDDFIELYQEARYTAITTSNIASGWKKTGLLPYNPSIVLDIIGKKEPAQITNHFDISNKSLRPSTPPEAVLSYDGHLGRYNLLVTPSRVEHYRLVSQLAGENAVFTEDAFKKVSKTAYESQLELIALGHSLKQLQAVEKRKKTKEDRDGGNYGSAKFMDWVELDFRKYRDEAIRMNRILMPPNKRPAADITREYKRWVRLEGAWLFHYQLKDWCDMEHFDSVDPRVRPTRPLPPGIPPKKTPPSPKKTAPPPPKKNAPPPAKKRLWVMLPIRVTSAQLAKTQQAGVVGDTAEEQLGRGKRATRAPKR